jgi:HTH-type transcriptional regulator/antitoxin HigA
MATAGYLELLREAQPQIIDDERSHERALRTVEKLMKKRRLTVRERKLLELLAKLVDEYEETIYPTPDVSPADMLAHFIEAKETTQAELARQTGVSRSTISEALKGKRSISVENAFRLAEYFHVEPSLFLARR